MTTENEVKTELPNPRSLDLGKLAEDAMQEEVEANLLPLIKKNASKLLEKMVEGAFASYGFLGRQFEEAFKDQVKINLDSISGYNDLISKSIEEELSKYLGAQVGAELAEKALKSIRCVSDVDKITASDIIERFKVAVIEDQYRIDTEFEGTGDITAIVEPREYGSTSIYLDAKPDIDKYSCQFRFMIRERDEKTGKDGYLFGLTCGYKYIHEFPEFGRFLYALQASEVPVDLDVDEYNVNTNVEREDDEYDY